MDNEAFVRSPLNRVLSSAGMDYEAFVRSSLYRVLSSAAHFVVGME